MLMMMILNVFTEGKFSLTVDMKTFGYSIPFINYGRNMKHSQAVIMQMMSI